ncbi:Polyprenol monophosphomannose synthase [Pontiella desulfatans]|uniref:dolichyl-phosphate beta-glucosyltransferase n=1 Tax=Pontiella desulfatans TaxID=2750659 RepID=A0A6C2TXW4_PONDE|nr:glycosyltransferase [Pontiella desulfatans]VGO12274.1 Polyprenol monophosphomannose synthase [Pontiella desulfatans]
MKFSIVIPAHNEEQRLPPVLDAYAQFFAHELGEEAEIILVANGCTDATAVVAKDIARNHSNIRVIDEPNRIGKGGAVILGAKAAVGDYIGFVDADGATSPEEFFRLYTIAAGKDGVIASRWMKGADVVIPQRAMRLLSSRTFNWITRILLGLKYKDTQCGAKIFKAEAWNAILPNIGTTRFAFDVDILYQLKRHNYTVAEEPTVWRDIEGSKVRFFNSSLDMFLAIVRMRLLYSPLKFTVRLYDQFLARIVEFLRRDSLFCHAMMLFMASMVANVCNVAFQMVVVRALSPVDYALLATFLSLFAIVSRPLGTLATATTHYTSLLLKEGRSGTVKRLVRKWMLIAGVPSILSAAVCILFARQIAALFDLERIAPVVVSAAALPALFLTPVVGGTLRGMQQFGWSAVASVAGAIGRVAIGAALVLLLFPACGWALVGHVGGAYINLLITMVVLLLLVVRFPADSKKLPSFRLYLFQCFFIQFGMALLMNGDVVFVKHFLPAETDFAKAATLGRMVVFLTASVTMAMFPKVSSSGEFTKEHRRIYLRGVAYTSFFLTGSFLFCVFFPRFLLGFLFRVLEPSPDLIAQTRWMAVVMGISVLLGINSSLLLAQRRFKAAAIVVVSALLYYGGVQLFHGNSFEIIAVAGGANMLGLVVTTWFILKQKTEDG